MEVPTNCISFLRKYLQKLQIYILYLLLLNIFISAHQKSVVIRAVEELGHSPHGLAHHLHLEVPLLGAHHLGLPPFGQQPHGVESSVGEVVPGQKISLPEIAMIQWSCLTCAAGVVRRMKKLSLLKRKLKARMM